VSRYVDIPDSGIYIAICTHEVYIFLRYVVYSQYLIGYEKFFAFYMEIIIGLTQLERKTTTLNTQLSKLQYSR
jgi:hypothetical protein